MSEEINVIKLIKRNNVKLDIIIGMDEEDIQKLTEVLESSKTAVDKCFEIIDYICDKYKLCAIGKQSFKIVLNNKIYYIQLKMDAKVVNGVTELKRKCIITYANT